MSRSFVLRPASLALALCVGAAAVARSAAATIYAVGPGEQMLLTEDLVLQIGDEIVAEATPESPCVIEGQGHGIRTVENWQGRLVIRNCTVHAVGRSDLYAMRVQAVGASQILLEGAIFDESGGVFVTALDATSVDILRNTVLENSVVDVRMDSSERTTDAMRFEGYSNTGLKRFQGNRIFKSRAAFAAVQNWLIGGDQPGEGNIIVGTRGAIIINGNSIRIVGNYIRSSGDLNGWNQVKPLEMQGGGLVVEHNVIRDGNWLVDLAGDAEIRYNVLGDSHDRPWLILEQRDGTQLVHHNIFMRNDPRFNVDGMFILRPESANPAEVYNNTIYGGGACWRDSGPAVSVEPGAFLASFRSNAVVGFATDMADDTAMIRGGGTERLVGGEPPGTPLYEPKYPPPERLGYADYNLFFNPKAVRRDNYGVAVPGKQERIDSGFARHDAPMGGNLDDQVDPLFAGMIPVAFPYSDEDIKAGAATVCQMLMFYRGLFAPGAGSPLVGAGDPADGPGNNIGAIGGADDRFASICAAGDVGTPNLTAEAFACPKLPPIPTPDVPGGRGFVCVCDVATGPTPSTLGLWSVLAAAAILFRRRRRA